MELELGGVSEQFFGKVAEIGLSLKLLNEADSLQVEITDGELWELLQGKVSSLHCRGEGLVTVQGLHCAEIDIAIAQLAVNPLSLSSGHLELTHASEVVLEVTLTTEDLNRALGSQFLRRQLEQWRVPYQEDMLIVELQQAQCQLPGEDQLELSLQVQVHLRDRVYPAVCCVQLSVPPDTQQVLLAGGHYCQGQALPLGITAALLSGLNHLLGKHQFQLNNLCLVVQHGRIKLAKGRVKLWSQLRIESASSN